MVRSAYRGLVAGALGLPLMFGMPSVALASDYDGNADRGEPGSEAGDKKPGKAYFTWIEELNKWVKVYEDNRETEQSQTNETEQENENTTNVYQISFGNKGDTDQTVANTTEQENETEAEQAQAVDQSTNVNPPAEGEMEKAPSKDQQAQQDQQVQKDQQAQTDQQAQSSEQAPQSAQSAMLPVSSGKVK